MNLRLIKNPVFFFIFLIVSCVPAQKFREVESKYKNCNEDLETLKQQQEQLTVENTEMKRQLAKNDSQIKSLIMDSVSKTAELLRIKNENDKLSGQYSDMQEAQEAILKGNARETARLMKQLQATQDDLKKKEESLKLSEKRMDEKKLRLDNMQLEIEKRDARVAELEKVLFRKDSVVTALKTKVSGSLSGFEDESLAVKVKNGKVYVSLEEKLLFKSASITVEPKGVEALKKLAKVLEQNPDINITIEGHTDNVQLKSSNGMKDNWDLSTLRATSIIRILLDNSKIDPKRLTASGRGEYVPVANNKTSENRAKNRRTEIILTPKLDELFKILETN